MIRGRIEKLRGLMARFGIDAYIAADSDPHSSEYVASHWKARSWLSGFDGSNGALVVTRDEAALWTDGRYYIQAQSQLEGSGIELMRSGEPDTPERMDWIRERMGPSSKIGIDGRTFSCAEYAKLEKALGENGASIAIECDVAGSLWDEGRPDMPEGPLFKHDLRYAGKTAFEKISETREELRRRNADHTLISGLEDVAWLFNIRGSDIEKLPVAYAHAFISMDSAELYIDRKKVSEEMRADLADRGIRAIDAADLPNRIENLNRGDAISLDFDKVSIWLRNRVPAGVRVINSPEPTIKLKAIKNDAEIGGHRECQLWDGAAMVRFMMWVESRAEAGTAFDEWDASLALSRFRAMAAESRGDSFNTIAGYGSNGAMMHYAPKEGRSAQIFNSGLMVVDSGGQYPGGTTDVTRTIVFGSTTQEERRDFTITLKSHIALASARFLYGATGAHIDSIARKVMWDNGLDYKCGTGHGVGSYLSVHEGPQSIGMRIGPSARLEENMIVSIEPGVYREGRHGVRIENLARIAEDFVNEFGRFMRFEMLSLCPIGLAGVEANLLDTAERGWLNDYHREVREKLAPFLDADEREWLARETREI